MGRLDSKVAVITGAADGMGAAHAKLFVNEGAKVVLTDIQEDLGKKLAEELGDSALFIKLDVTNKNDWDNVVSKTEETFGPINILVNNAGMSYSEPTLDMSEDSWNKVVDLNQTSIFLGTKAVVPSMKKAENGSIVNVSSISGFVGQSAGLAYNATKFAVRGMTKSSALEFADDNIRVNSVHPGIIQTNMIDQILQAGGEGKDIVESLEKDIPLKRLAQPEEISYLVLYLASDESSYSTGSEFVADGGLIAK